MGNFLPNVLEEKMDFPSVDDFKFHDMFEDDSPNGLYFNSHYLPQEILWEIFTYIPPADLLKLTLVCKKWCNIIKSDNFWMHLYKTFYPNKVKNLPWYVYYSFFTTNNFKNFLRNTNGELRFKHWIIHKELGDKFQIECPPAGADTLPLDVEDFNGKSCCFATSYFPCIKIQV